MYLNKAIIIGNLTRDPELKALPNGTSVTSFSVATNRVWKDKNNDKQEAVDYHNIIVFGRQADSCAQWLKKGSSVLVEGRLQTRSWEDKEGKKLYKTEIVSESIQFGPRAGKKEPSENGKPAEKSTYLEKATEEIQYPNEEIDPDSIPF